jgi:hypothetical protein
MFDVGSTIAQQPGFCVIYLALLRGLVVGCDSCYNL